MLNEAAARRMDRRLTEAKRKGYIKGVQDAVAFLREHSPVTAEYIANALETQLLKGEHDGRESNEK